MTNTIPIWYSVKLWMKRHPEASTAQWCQRFGYRSERDLVNAFLQKGVRSWQGAYEALDGLFIAWLKRQIAKTYTELNRIASWTQPDPKAPTYTTAHMQASLDNIRDRAKRLHENFGLIVPAFDKLSFVR